jgi:HAD superfamily hydrolase (TIGR01509 family)
MYFRGILFDLDGTLLDSERESAEAMARALRRGVGLEVDQIDRDAVIGHSWVDIFEHLRGRYGDFGWTRDQLIAASAEERPQVIAEVGLRFLPGVFEAIERFRHLPMAIVTGSSRAEARHAIELLGLEDVIRTVLASEDVARSKPAPDGYLAAAGALGLDPRTCLVVEDSESGILAGVAAGCHVFGVAAGNFAGEDQSAAHHRLATLEELTLELVTACRPGACL